MSCRDEPVSIRAVEETLARSLHGAFSPAEAFGTDFVLTIEQTTRTDILETLLEEGQVRRPSG